MWLSKGLCVALDSPPPVVYVSQRPWLLRASFTFVAPQLPSAHECEIKHDGFRLIASRDRSAFG
jgi:hypothetical protein